MDKAVIEQIIKNNGDNPDDFNITIYEDGYQIAPKKSYEIRAIAKECYKPVIEDINVVAETIVVNMNDLNDIAETIAFLMSEIESLKIELEVLKNG